MSRELPAKPNLEHLRKQAKHLLRDFQRGEPAAVERLRSILGTTPKLADAQHVIARDYGFANWAKLKQRVEDIRNAGKPGELLSLAVCASDADRVAQVLEEYPELKGQLNDPMADYDGMQAILAAVQRSDRKTVQVLLRAGADIHARSRSWTPGIGVLDECAEEMAEFLIECGAVMDIHSAARLGRFEKVQEFVKADPSVVRARGADGQTPLHFASTVEIAEYLLEHGAEVDARDLQHESTAAQHMLRVVQARHYHRDRQEIARHLLARGCQTDLFMAAALGDLPLVRRHVEANPDRVHMRVSEVYFPKQDPRSGGTIYIYQFGPNRTPHQVARDFGHEAICQYLTEHSPRELKLAQAFELGDEETVRGLLAERPTISETLTEQDRRRLPDAAQNNNANAVRLMLQAGWPVDARGEYDMTALQWAAWHGNAGMVREILAYGPRLELDCDHGITALGSALHGSMNGWHRDTGDYAATVEELLQAGAKAPPVTEDLEASEAAREALRRHEQGLSSIEQR